MICLFAAAVTLLLPLANAPSPLGPGAGLPEVTATCRTTAPLPDEKVLKALEAWLKTWRAGKIPFTSRDGIIKDSIAAKFGLLPKGMLGNVTWERDLEILVELAVQLDNAPGMLAVLEVAAVGLDGGKYTREMAPYAVRAVGERWLGKFTSPAAKEELAKAARGEIKGDRASALAMRAAALRGLGRSGDQGSRPMLEQQLGVPDQQVRLAAAEGLGLLGQEASAEALAAAVDREQNETVLLALVQSLRACYARYLAAPAAAPATGDGAAAAAPTAPASSRLAVQAVIKALGRTTWRADMALVQFLDDFRSVETIPALIAVLQRFKDRPDEIQSGKLSGLLLHRAHEVLVGMTGAVFPADAPEKWRELWEREKDKFQVAARPNPAAAAGNTVSTGFCGIPVQGTRVVFILDLSGSMNFPMRSKDTRTGVVPDKVPTRIDFAKKELLRAMDALSPQASFNLVTFNGNPKPVVWNKDLVPANDKNRERFRKYVNELRADGGTNLWCGLEEALKIKSLVYGDRYESNVDEIFLLSDGAPTVGDVLDPIEILRLVQETNRFARVRLNTVFISTPDAKDPLPPTMTITPEELMKRMAEQNGGKYVNL